MRRELTHGSLFSGIEGFGLGAALAGIKTELSEMSDPIMPLSKITLNLENEDSSTSYMDFPKSGMMHSGNVYRVASLDCNNVGKEYIYHCLPRV